MMDSIQKTSLFVPSQLPEYIRDDPNYANFVAFIKAYYSWMEENGNVLDFSKNILTYQDVDSTTQQFLDYYVNDFLQNFPKDVLIDQNRLIRFARELYKTKGTNPSFEFLFRILYDSDFESFNTRDFVFRASAGTWFVFKSLRLATDDPNFLNISNYRIFGESTKSIATIENSTISGTKTEVFISNIERLFQSGEYIIVVDNANQPVYFKNGTQVSANTPGAETLRAKIVGQISQINIDPKNRGSFYKSGDPVVVYGGLNSSTGIGASAVVGQTTTGGVKSIIVDDGGFGYRNDPNTVISFSNLNSGAKTPSAVVGSLTPYLLPLITISNGGVGYQNNDPIYVVINSNPYNFAHVSSVDANGKIIAVGYNTGVAANSVLGITANVNSVNTSAHGAVITVANSAGGAIANVTYMPTNAIGLGKNVPIGNTTFSFLSGHPTSNANTSFANSLSFISFSTYPISSVLVTNQGGGITNQPDIAAQSIYSNDTLNNTLISSFGILSPIQIISGGTGYHANDTIVFSGGSGYGAFANVTSVDSSGSITGISYIQGKSIYPLGGMGYDIQLPTVSVKSSNVGASGAIITVTGILGAGARLSSITDRAGAVTSINILNFGEDYIATPNVSLKVQDIVVSNILVTKPPIKGDIIYQGINSNNSSYIAFVDSYTLLIPDVDPTKTLYNLRLFEYTSIPDPTLPLKIDRNNIVINIANKVPIGYESQYPLITGLNIQGFASYGDGTAKASAVFLNGLVVGQGQYLNTQGQPSSFTVLQNEVYNNYTYQITVNKEIAKYREILLNLLHPSGTNVLGRYAMETESNYSFHSQDALFTGLPLADYTGYAGSTVKMVTDFTNKSNNIITFSNLVGANIATFISTNNIVEITTANGPYVKCEVNSVDYTSNTVTLQNNTWLTYANVAYVQANSGSNVINIKVLTGAYDIMNNGVYSDPTYPLKDIVYAGDTVKITGNGTIFTVISVNYINETIVVSPNLPAISNSLIAVNRTFGPTSCVRIFGPVGTQYIPQLTTENDVLLTTEDDNILILG